MTSRERLLAALAGQPQDHAPLTTWSFGFRAPPHLRWRRGGRETKFWYSGRLEHIHTLPQPWTVEDEGRRAAAWLSLGADDVLEVSVPWSRDPEVTWEDTVLPAGAPGGDARYPVMVREYRTPAGHLRHAVKKTGAEAEGWVRQPDHVDLFEDYNIPRAVRQAVSRPEDVSAIRPLFTPPDPAARRWFAARVAQLKAFAGERGLCLQAWAAFGMDAAVWLTGVEGAVLMALEEPAAFGQLLELIFRTDYARTELAATTPGVDIICQRGWYSGMDFWSPNLFDQFVVPGLKQLTALAHRHGRRFGYVITTGVEKLGPSLAEAGVDLLYFVDPVQDRFPVEKARELLADRMTLVGGTNALSLASGDRGRIRDEVRRALEVLAPTHRFVLHPVDAIFPDTPWEGVETMIAAWKEFYGLR